MDAINTTRGILVGWNKDKIEVLDSKVGIFSVSIKCRSRVDSFVWNFAGVYGHTDGDRKSSFLKELMEIRSLWHGPWCLGGDFNLV